MARPIKKGLDYFPLDVDFFNDDKIRFISAVHGEIGELIAIKLLCKIYRQDGYFLKWDEDTSILFATECGRSVVPEHLNQVVKELVRRNFFDRAKFENYSILTSSAIQRRYSKICTDSKRKGWEIVPDFLVSDGVAQEFTPLTPEFTPLTPEESTQSKVKESIEKESTEKRGSVPAEPLEKRRQIFINRIAEHAKGYERKMLNEFYSYWSEKSEGGSKMRFEKQTVFDIKRRLRTWYQKESATFNSQTPQASANNLTIKPL